MLGYEIFSSWAFSEGEKEKAIINKFIYDGLQGTYRILKIDSPAQNLYDIKGYSVNELSLCDIIITRQAGHNHAVYKIHKNRPGLSELELALICDNGSLCFGYTKEGKDSLYVFED